MSSLNTCFRYGRTVLFLVLFGYSCFYLGTLSATVHQYEDESDAAKINSPLSSAEIPTGPTDVSAPLFDSDTPKLQPPNQPVLPYIQDVPTSSNSCSSNE